MARAPPLRRGGASFPCPAPAGGGSQSRGTVRWPRDRLLSRARARAQARRAEAWRRRWRCWAGPRPSSAARSGSSGDGGTRTGVTGDRWGVEGWGMLLLGGLGRPGSLARAPGAPRGVAARRSLTGVAVVCRVGGSAEKGLSRGISSDRPPKRPLTAYFRFMKENHNAFRQKNPGTRPEGSWVREDGRLGLFCRQERGVLACGVCLRFCREVAVALGTSGVFPPECVV